MHISETSQRSSLSQSQKEKTPVIAESTQIKKQDEHRSLISDQKDEINLNSYLWIKAGETKNRDIFNKYGAPDSQDRGIGGGYTLLRYTSKQHSDFRGWQYMSFIIDSMGKVIEIRCKQSGEIGKETNVKTFPMEKKSSYSKDSGDIMVEMEKRFPAIGPWTWTQDMSLWIKVPGSYANDKYSCKEIAESVARFYRSKKGHMVCVHIYYGNFHEIANACQ